MKYTCEIIIDLPRTEVIRKMDNAENMKHWQKGLVGHEFLSGEHGADGSTMKLEYLLGKREMVLTETIIANKFPDVFHATYDAKGVHNIQKNYFEEVDSSTTKWISECEFQFSGFGMKLMGTIMPGVFKKQSKGYMTDFKNFAEKGTSVSS